MTVDDHAESRTRLSRAAIEWAGGARGQVLVDAAAEALADGLDSPTLRILAGGRRALADRGVQDGLDSPTLRILAGAPRAAADEEATELGPAVFEELGLQIEPQLSPAAKVEASGLIAVDLLAGRWTPREATAALYRMYVASDYADELADFSGFDDYYDMLRDGIVTGSVATLDEDVMRAARSLAIGEPGASNDGVWSFLSNP